MPRQACYFLPLPPGEVDGLPSGEGSQRFKNIPAWLYNRTPQRTRAPKPPLRSVAWWQLSFITPVEKVLLVCALVAIGATVLDRGLRPTEAVMEVVTHLPAATAPLRA